MGAVSILLVGLLPLVFTTQLFFYHPLPHATFVQPLVYSLPSILPPSMGNRKHELFPKHTYVGNRKYDVFPRSQESTTYHSCRDLTADWQQWETGATGSIRIKRGKQDALTSDWEVDMVFDKPLSNLEVYNGVVDQPSGSKFKVTGTSWNARLAPGEDVKINFKATFEPNELAPSLTGLVVNGKYHDCKPPKKPPTTRMSSHPAWPSKIAGKNMVHFIRKLKQLNPSIIVSQPTYGWPQVQAEIDVINASWNSKGESQNPADSIGLMVYQGTQSLNYVKNYDSSKRWQGHPVSASVPNDAILLGAKGVTSSSDIIQLAQTSVKDNLLGIMVWYAYVDNGFQYKQSSQWDASINDDAIKGYKEAMKILKQGQSAIPRIYY